MIYIDFLLDKNNKETIGFRAAGHAQHGDTGNDIVCAAVSSALYMAVNTATEVIGIKPLALNVDDDGMMFFRLELNDTLKCKDILRGLKIHLIGLEEQYPVNLQVNDMEV